MRKKSTKSACKSINSDDSVCEDEEHLVRRKYSYKTKVFNVEKDGLCVGILVSGILYLEKCSIRIRPLNISRGVKFPAFIAKEQTTLKMLLCEIQGQISLSTVGIAVFNSNLFMSLCKLYNHIEGGMFLKNRETKVVKIMDCKFSDNKTCGIFVKGINSDPVIEECLFEGNDGAGVICYTGTMPKINKCTFKENIIGILVHCCDPVISWNRIQNSYNDGIVCRCSETQYCRGELKYNKIFENKENGIYCIGSKTNINIIHNLNITINGQAGIKISESASASIIRNLIGNNGTQGVLVTETSYAFIEKNTIGTNVKANIAFGGKCSANCVVYDNDIFGSKCEGIFCVEGGFSWVWNNNIHDNLDGIVALDSSPFLQNNLINFNQRCGVILSGQSYPKIYKNKILDNYTCGILIKENSFGIFENNIVFSYAD